MAVLGLNLPCVVAAGAALAVVGGHPLSAPLGIAAGSGVLLALLGAGAVLSVRAPLPAARTTFGVSPGLSARNVLVNVSATVVSLLWLAPGGLLLAYGLSGWAPGLYVSAPLLIVCGAGACAAGVRLATRWADTRRPELLDAVRPQ